MSQQVIQHSKSGEGGGWISEDWLALILGLVIFGLSLGAFKGTDLLGWGAKAGVWVRVFETLAERSPDSMLLIDSSIIRAHQQAATLKGGRITPSVALVAD